MAYLPRDVWDRILSSAKMHDVARAAHVDRASRTAARNVMNRRVVSAQRAWRGWRAGTQGLQRALRQARGIMRRGDARQAWSNAVARQGWTRDPPHHNFRSMHKEFSLRRNFLLTIQMTELRMGQEWGMRSAQAVLHYFPDAPFDTASISYGTVDDAFREFYPSMAPGWLQALHGTWGQGWTPPGMTEQQHAVAVDLVRKFYRVFVREFGRPTSNELDAALWVRQA